ncbi:G-protein coupled receptor 183-A isoform X2 [Phycodurus eques]|uniref:G-protein coupled receptor 183-A isoform X2 n=1 Tax=Phycodurus eques TaxID=693459 RepID=UPI002ACEE3D4|nr:G-protein coupled receptor 183-A isoform X2 [Phycodurus eques]XP_061548539.1 G-protein coupled receptor 183-A isoform X2 [Phycodurus eques]XP_061548540.1 G-protein coupled receptor 183-A isoform X2 [Phycodurus eques]XP_061548541.1 G-protein coupled receptor 183-A isoform X2 [Phycodurus eques]XP_061548542.1 G-protein coupled receptor 183-A isoform X2 [Phycodurus eques]
MCPLVVFTRQRLQRHMTSLTFNQYVLISFTFKNQNMVMAAAPTPVLGARPSADNDSACDTLYAHRSYARVFMPLVYCAVFLVGLLGNVLALHVIRPNLKKMNSTTLYSLNLVISDILFTLSLPFRISYYALGFHWPLGEAACKISGLVFYINTYAGVNFMTCLSVDRFIAVVLPLRFSRLRNVSNVRYICVGVWLLVLGQTLPLLGMPMTNAEADGFVTCMEYPNFDKVDHIAAILIGGVFLGYVVPVVTILVCYSFLCSKLRSTAKSNRLMEKSGRSRKAIGVICCVSLVFVLCYSPYHINILQYMVRKLASRPDCADLTAFQVSLHITVCLMNLNACLDPFVYFFACKGYKRKLLKLLRLEVSMSVSSVVRTSPEGSSKDFIDGNNIQLSGSASASERRSRLYV